MTTAVLPQAASAQAVKLPKNRGTYYGGAWHEPKAGRFVDTISPGTGQSLGKVADSGAEDIDAADCGNPVKEMVSDAMIAAAQMEFFAGFVTEMKGSSIPMGPDVVNFSI